MNEQRTMDKNVEQQIQQALQDIQIKKKKFLKQHRQEEISMLLPKKSLRKIQNSLMVNKLR